MEVTYLFLCLSILWQGCSAIMWSLAPNTQKCLKEELHANVLVAGEYEVSQAAGQKIDYIVSKLNYLYTLLLYRNIVPSRIFDISIR